MINKIERPEIECVPRRWHVADTIRYKQRSLYEQLKTLYWFGDMKLLGDPTVKPQKLDWNHGKWRGKEGRNKPLTRAYFEYLAQILLG